jgi:DNA-binding CsgD family transcriptional regulator
MAPSNNGFLLLDAAFNLIASDDAALEILCYPSGADRIKQPKVFIADRVRSTLLDHKKRDGRSMFVTEFMSGKRRFTCKAIRVNCNEVYSVQPAFAVSLERTEVGSNGLTEISERYGLTHRERETVEFLLQGFTSKEIANRMGISANTVKAFVRMVMVKMSVSTRSGIAGKVAGSRGVMPQQARSTTATAHFAA